MHLSEISVLRYLADLSLVEKIIFKYYFYGKKSF